jgi:ribosomal-protein-alanine N-acetyltransferase
MKWFRIRRARPEDIEQVYALEKKCFPTPWSRADILRDLSENPLAFYVVAERNEDIVGYAGLWTVLDEGHITNIAVAPEERRGGIALMLLSELFRAAKERGVSRYTLEVRQSNAIAIHLYQKLGFQVAGYRKGYYADNNEDAAIMWLTMNEEITEDVFEEEREKASDG